jgi:protease-4
MRKFLWAVGVFGFIICLAVSLRFTQSAGDKVLKLEFDGAIEEVQSNDILGALSGNSSQSIHTITSSIRRAAQDPEVKGIFFHISNLDIGLAQLQDVADAMAVFKKSGKWSVSYLDTAGEFSSGNLPFCLASTTDSITISPTGYVNLIGLRAESAFFKKTLEFLEIDVLVEQRHEYKSAAAPFAEEKYTKAHLESTQSLLQDVQSTLIELLATHRGIDDTVARAWFEQGPYNVQEARDKGIIQTVGYYDQVLDNLEARMKDDWKTISLEQYQETGKLYQGSVPVALVIAEGPIHRGESSADPSVGSDTLTRAIRNARKDGVEGLLLRVDSPGGSVIASDVIRREIELTKAAGIPVVVSMGNLAASGGYYISLDADYIVAQPGTITGSIGVIAMLTSMHRTLKNNLKVTFDSYKTMDNGDTFSMMKLPEGQRLTQLQKSIDYIYDDFLQKVSNGRKMDLEKVQEIAKGRVWSGLAAHKNGLVDELGDVHLALDRLQERMNLSNKETIRIEVYPQEDNPLAMLRSLIGVSLKLPNEVKVALDALKILSSPADAMLRVPVLPTIE